MPFGLRVCSITVHFRNDGFFLVNNSSEDRALQVQGRAIYTYRHEKVLIPGGRARSYRRGRTRGRLNRFRRQGRRQENIRGLGTGRQPALSVKQQPEQRGKGEERGGASGKG